MKRMKWNEFIEKDEKVKLPEAFAKVLKAQEINPFELDTVQPTIEQVLEICKLFCIKEEAHNDPKVTGALKIFLRGIEELWKNMITKVILELGETYDPNKHAGYITFYWICWLAQMTKAFKLTSENENSLQNILTRTQVNWGTQHALWHALKKGKLAQVGRDMKADVVQINDGVVKHSMTPLLIKHFLGAHKI